MQADNWQNCLEMLLDQADRLKDAPFLWHKADGAYRSESWRQVALRIGALAAALQKLGLERGDRIVLLSENRPEWLIADLAILAAGGITVPAYTTNTESDHLHILEDSGARGAILSTAALARRFLPAAHRSDRLQFAITMQKTDIAQRLNVEIHHWDDVVAPSPDNAFDLREASARLARGDPACIIYTSGTGGAPKGVVLHHGAILHNCAGATDVLQEVGLGNDRFLSFLPLSHAYEHSGGQFFPISIAAEIYYAESIERLARNFLEARPTVVTVVPRIFEMLRGRILQAVEQKGGSQKRLFDRALEIGLKRHDPSQRLSPGERVADRALDLLVRRKIRARFGGRIKALISGGAPLNPDVGRFFQAMGLRLLQGYGQTESGPVVSVNRPSHIKMDTVGPPMKDTEIKIADDGEILIRGELVMQGYWRDDLTSRRVLSDGWLHTGDIGVIDEDGHLKITDRKKDLIVNDKGDNLSPQRIEGMLTLQPEISQAMIYGDRRPYIVGIIVPDTEWLSGWCRQAGKGAELKSLVDDGDLRAALSAAVSRVNKELSNYERLRRFIVASEPFSIDNDQLTPTMKVRRHVITALYRKQLDGLYHDTRQDKSKGREESDRGDEEMAKASPEEGDDR